jgi:hypothetical protein
MTPAVKRAPIKRVIEAFVGTIQNQALLPVGPPVDDVGIRDQRGKRPMVALDLIDAPNSLPKRVTPFNKHPSSKVKRKASTMATQKKGGKCRKLKRVQEESSFSGDDGEEEEEEDEEGGDQEDEGEEKEEEDEGSYEENEAEEEESDGEDPNEKST